jgi:hypothetical protein
MSNLKTEIKRDVWRPEERKIWVRKQMRWSWGWTINFAEIARRLRARRR